MARRNSNIVLDCTDEIGRAAAKVCADECSRKCSMVLLGLFFAQAKYLLTSGIHFNFKEFLIEQIEKYQKDISPKLSSVCLFEPSCSNYALLSIQKYGIIKGVFKTAIRIFKCSPLTKRLPAGHIIDIP